MVINKTGIAGWRWHLAAVVGIVFVLPFMVDTSLAQLRELEVTPEEPPETIPVFRNHPDEAAVIIFSSLTDLQIESNMGIVEDLSRPVDGRYVLMVGPFRQILTIRAQGFQETRITVPNMSTREVSYYSVEPREREPVTGRGTLILRSIPDGAWITVDGYPDFEQQTPYTFADWSAQSYRIRVELDKYQVEEFVISIPEGQAISRTLELVPDHGFVRIHEEGTLRVQYQNEGSPSRTVFIPGEPIELPIGNHTLELSRDKYETARKELLIHPGETTDWRPDMIPSYGYIVVHEEGILRVRYHDQGIPARVDYQVGQPVEVPVGEHHVELIRDYYENESAMLSVNPGQRVTWQPESRPTYGQLRVRANTDVNIEVEDNQAPLPPSGADYLYVEAGRKQVRVTAPNYVADEFTIVMTPGGHIDTTLTLMTLAEAQSLERRREQPRGVIMAAADLAATEIWINGEMVGRGFANATVLTGRHEVEFRHDSGVRKESVYVRPADMEQVYVQLRPSRSGAIFRSALLPGSGHLYTDRGRGAVYLAVYAGAVIGTSATWLYYRDINNDYQAALDNYRQATSTASAIQAREEYLRLHDERIQAHDIFRYLAFGTAAVYAISFLDILVTRPPYGYRTGEPPERFTISTLPVDRGVPIVALTYRRNF